MFIQFVKKKFLLRSAVYTVTVQLILLSVKAIRLIDKNISRALGLFQFNPAPEKAYKPS